MLILQAVDEKEAYANIELNKVLEAFRPEKLERAFTTELVYGTLRHLKTIDWILGRFLKRPLADLTVWVRNILRLGVYQLVYVDRIPPSAACNESVNLVKRYGHKGTVSFANGVLRNVSRNLDALTYPDRKKDPVKHIAVVYSHPEWMVEKWLNQFGEEATIELCKANNQPGTNTIRTNTLKITRDELKKVLEEQGINVEFTKWATEGLVIEGFYSLNTLAAFRDGLFQVQDESSMLVAPIVDAQPGDIVVDTSAAPGGKTTHLAQRMENTGVIHACDIHPHKLELIEENCRRLGISIVETHALDARNLPVDWRGKAQRVLVDAPCSGLGVLKRRPDARWRKRPEDIIEIQELQLAILDSAAQMVASGGVLVYSTCTITPEENQQVVEQFITKHPDFRLDSLAPFLPQDFKVDHQQPGYLQILPHIHGMDGFFMARMIKA